MSFRIRLDAVRGTPSRTEDTWTVTRLMLEAYPREGHGPSIGRVGAGAPAVFRTAPSTATPIEQVVTGAIPVMGASDHTVHAMTSSAGRRHGMRAAP